MNHNTDHAITASDTEPVTELLRLAEAINAAMTYQDVLEAVAPVLPDCQGVYLNLWEHLDYEKASYLEIAAAASVTEQVGQSIGHRFLKTDFPFIVESRSEKLLVVENVQTDPRIDALSRRSYAQIATQAYVRVPFQRENRLIGALFFKYTHPRTFAERERRLARGIAGLVLAAIERITAQQETAAAVDAQREALVAEQEARAEMGRLYQVSRAINQATDLNQVLAATKQLFPDPIHIGIFAWEHYDYRQATYLELLASTDDRVKNGIHLPLDLVIHPALLETTGFMVANDLSSPEWANHPAVAAARYLGLYSTAYTNLIHADQFQGIFAIACYQPYAFSPQQIRLMRATADLTAAAMERFRSRQAEQEALQDREQLLRASQAINAANSFKEILEAVAHIDFDNGDHYLYIFENFDCRTATYIETVATSSSRFMQMGMRIPLDQVPFLRTHPRPGLGVYENIPEHPELDAVTKATMQSHGTVSNLRYGLVRHGRLLGSFGVDHAIPKRYTEREKRLMIALGELVSAAVERIRLQGEMHAARERAERLAEQAQQLAALEERTHLARELHDSVSQALYGIGLGAQTAQRYLDSDPQLARESVDYILSLAQAGLAEMRALIFELRPESLQTEGLVIALAKQGASLQARHQIQVQLELGLEPPLPLATKESLYRVLREALHNVIKHAHASQVILRINDTGSEWWFEVIDNGVGFIASADFPGHLGLKSMRERISEMGGALVIDTAPGQGTRLTVKLSHAL
jgi:signal transduction histidine kinase